MARVSLRLTQAFAGHRAQGGARSIGGGRYGGSRDQERKFDAKVQDVAKRHEGKLTFRYTGPFPPYNFVTIRLQLERSAGV